MFTKALKNMHILYACYIHHDCWGFIFFFFRSSPVETMLLKQYIEINRELSQSYSGIWYNLDNLIRNFLRDSINFKHGDIYLLT